MRVLVLSWSRPRPGPAGQALGLAAALQAVGEDVRLLTRAEGAGPVDEAADPVPTRCFVDVPPLLPADGLAAGLSDASRATAHATRWSLERPVDVVHADGTPTLPAALALRTALGARLVTVVDEPTPSGPTGSGPTASGPTRSGPTRPGPTASDELLAAARAAGPVLVRGAVHGPDRLGYGVGLPERRPGPPPRSGGVRLVPPPGEPLRPAARALRRALREPHRVGGATRRRPRLVAVADPAAVEPVLDALAAGVPVVVVEGGATAALVHAAGAGVVVPPGGLPGAVDALLHDTTRAAALGAAGAAHARSHLAWARVAAAWRAAVGADGAGDGLRLAAPPV